jgi:hypothetical protein
VTLLGCAILLLLFSWTADLAVRLSSGWTVNLSSESCISAPTPLYSREIKDRSPRLANSGGKFAAAWTLETGAYRGILSTSADSGTSWTPPRLLHPQYPHPGPDDIFGQSDICVSKSGRVIIAVTYMRQQATGPTLQNIGLYEHRETHPDSVWIGPTFPMEFFDPGILGRSTTLLDQPAIACEPVSGDLYLAFTRRTASSDSVGGHFTEIRFVGQVSGTWGRVRTLATPASERARIVVGVDKSVLVYWHDMASGGVVGRQSTDGGRTFGEPIVIGRMLANYSEPPRYLNNDVRHNRVYCDAELAPHYAAITVDRSQGPRRGWMYGVWAEMLEGVAEPIVSSATEREPNSPSDRATRMEYGQSMSGGSIGPDIGGGDTDCFYFEGQRGETVQITGQVTGASAPGTNSYCGWPLDLNYWESPTAYRGRMGAGSFNQGPILNPPLVMTLPVSGRYSLDGVYAGANWRVNYVLRAQRLTPLPTSVARDHRDVVIVVSKNGGLTWSEKRLVNDDPPWFDNSMPEVAVDGLGRVHVGWYDRRDDPEGMNYHVYWTWSEDGGETFVPSRALSATQSVLDPDEWTELGDHWSLIGTEDGIAGAWTFATGEDVGNSRNEHNIHFRRAWIPVEVEVDDLAAAVRVRRADLSWRIDRPDYLWRFRVGRRVVGGPEGFVVIGEVERNADWQVSEYAFSDTTVVGSTEYEYRIEALLANETVIYSEAVVAGVPPTPEGVSLRVASRGGPSVLELTSPLRGSADFQVFDVQGGRVRTITGIAVEPGVNEIEWDVRGDGGMRLASGVYFVRAHVGPHEGVLKIVVTP